MTINGDGDVDAWVSLMTPRHKKAFFEHIQQQHKELSRRQREYIQALTRRLKTRAEIITEQGHAKAIERLRKERNDLRAQIWVASGQCFTKDDEECLEQIGCHVKCQEHLNAQIGSLKKLISNLKSERRRIDKEIYELNRKTIADGQYQEYVANGRKKLQILENRLEVKIRHESSMGAENASLRQQIRTLVTNRQRFGVMYSKCMQKLHIDQKYLTDLLDFASSTMEGGIDMIEKITNSRRKNRKETEHAKVKMQSNMREARALELACDFSNCKNQQRFLAPLQEKEKLRRRSLKRLYVKKIGVYNTAIGILYQFTNSHNIGGVIEKFQEHESLYHSFFAHINRTGFHMTALETAVEQLYERVAHLKVKRHTNLLSQRHRLEFLKQKLDNGRDRNEALNKQGAEDQKHLDKLFSEIGMVFNMCQADAKPLFALLGQQNYINIHNLRGFLVKLEARLQQIVNSVYVRETQDQQKPPAECAIKDLRKDCDMPTHINDIVLTQQCPECAEGTVNIDNGGDIDVLSLAVIRQKLFEDVNQPDMQYRLHSISQCRLPKSRQLVAQRHVN